MNKSNTTLADYMNYVSDEAFNLEGFVEHGGRMQGARELGQLKSGLADLAKKIDALRDEHPQFARQLEFLVDYFATDPWNQPDKVRNETIFALLYAAKEMDLLPDDMPDVGYLDDAAVAESVLGRHAWFFERYCAAKDIDWTEVKPATSH